MIRLRELRKQKGLTMKQLGDLVGLAESTISLYETGKRQPDQDTMVFFADFFGISIDYLLGREEETEQASTQAVDRLKRVAEDTKDFNEQEMQLVHMFIEQIKKSRK